MNFNKKKKNVEELNLNFLGVKFLWVYSENSRKQKQSVNLNRQWI